MTQTIQNTLAPQGKKSRKIRALAAGGAVLGLGAAVTLASWSDSEFADGIFTTQNFGIEATNTFEDSGWGEHEAAGEGQALRLTFASEGAETMYPGQTIVVPYQIRNIAEGADSVVEFADESIVANSTGTEIVDNNHLSAAIYEVGPTQDCSTDLDALTPMVKEVDSFTLTGDEPQRLCVAVTLAEGFGETSSQSATITWEFEATHPEASVTP